ncbi:hypothetical protein M422DRAFT_266196 [Sphaerobolus stellatus SS14]|uniref:MARVEL domain-containing protein n=1 Tax=Sphaerobolus stellatus (strain SS14) TaxID=990650 RepID=A0A0C9V3L3_SPHS4|nr:hypothetical protein M422DRAFT_266196 [Sphaerobolus stellatus SS14]
MGISRRLNHNLFITIVAQQLLYAARLLANTTAPAYEPCFAQHAIALSGVHGASSLVLFYTLGREDWKGESPNIPKRRAFFILPVIALFMVITTAFLTACTFNGELLLRSAPEEFKITLGIVGCSWSISTFLICDLYILLGQSDDTEDYPNANYDSNGWAREGYFEKA